jgi:hypothetical protein
MLNRCHDYEAFAPNTTFGPNIRRMRISIALPDHEVRDVPDVDFIFAKVSHIAIGAGTSR